MSKKFATYHKHYRPDSPQGHIFLDKEGACTIHLHGAAAMSQDELDHYGKVMASALCLSQACKNLFGSLPLSKEIEDE